MKKTINTSDAYSEGTALADSYYMHEALKLARCAYDLDEVPIGALVVSPNGSIIGRGYNQVEFQKTQRAHAESIALQEAAQTQGDWRLDECTVYVTLEPCAMCMGLIRLSRIKRIVFATDSPLFGHRLDNSGGSRVYKKDVEIVSGIAALEAQQLLKLFFQAKRKKKR